MPVDLPASTAQPQERPDKPIFLRSKQTARWRSANDPLPLDQLAASTMDSASKGDHDQRVFLRADRAVTYGDVMEVMNALRNAGYLKVALVGLENREAK